jgi:hypothetical protein
LPCKVLEVKQVTDSKSFYNIFSKDGILKTYYSDEDLVDLRTVCFPGLNFIDLNLLLEIFSYLLQHLVKFCMRHLLEQGILDLRHEHRIVFHFPAQLHVGTRLAVSFTVWFFWQA